MVLKLILQLHACAHLFALFNLNDDHSTKDEESPGAFNAFLFPLLHSLVTGPYFLINHLSHSIRVFVMICWVWERSWAQCYFEKFFLAFLRVTQHTNDSHLWAMHTFPSLRNASLPWDAFAMCFAYWLLLISLSSPFIMVQSSSSFSCLFHLIQVHKAAEEGKI